jgi:tricorn protease-like protein
MLEIYKLTKIALAKCDTKGRKIFYAFIILTSALSGIDVFALALLTRIMTSGNEKILNSGFESQGTILICAQDSTFYICCLVYKY